MTQYQKYMDYNLEEAIKNSDLKHIKDFLDICDRKEDEYFFIRLLAESCEFGNIPTLKLLLFNYNMDINLLCNTMFFTPLMIATRNDQLETLQFLLEAGADPLKRDFMKRNFFHHMHNNSNIKKWILKYDTQKYLFNKFPALYNQISRTYLYHPDKSLEPVSPRNIFHHLLGAVRKNLILSMILKKPSLSRG
jgi:ankyrin repeat protein